ncbi:hypothetical protein NM688_g8295 [Phlebia brevispora]|uniref:Uncharacterized protein n=1 Tax=Phlebia brevispora TaxID=194682 RepID=A0ACC1RUT1_9APHY|nr:hypothetical protein NM688_g8295 [Phlebia brevispora]
MPADPSPLMKPLDRFGLGLQDSLDQSAVPGLIQPFEDGYSSQPGSPMDIPLVGLSQWGYPAPAMLTSDLPAPCDSYFDPAVIFSPHVF